MADFLTLFSLMPSLHKRPESPYWVASFQDTLGRWLKKSTKTADRKLALKMATAWEDAAHSGRKGRFVESQARKVLSEISEQATGEPMHFHTCRAWFDEWVAGKNGTTAEKTITKYRQVCGDFLAHLGDRANLPLSAISQRDLRGFRDELAKTGLSPSTVNQTVRKVLTAPFAAACRLGYITVNPCGGLDALRDEADTEKDVFAPEQVRALIDAAAGEWRGAILAGYFTGLRLRDIVDLTWSAIDFPSGVLRIKTRKTGAQLVLPIHPELSAWLTGQTRGIEKAPVFPTLTVKAGSGKSGLSMAFRKIMEKAGIKGRTTRTREEGSAGRTQSSLSFHSLRHSFNSALANAGVAQETRQKLTGHASAAMNAKYTHHEIDTLRDAVAKLPGIGS